ncbi:MAG: ABC transporter ATP-binding protein [Pseudomonadota bacterium]
MLRVETVEKSFITPQGPLRVLDGVSLTLEPGHSLALMGESGSGKSTLLHIIAGLEPADTGSIRLGETEITALGDAGRADLRRARLGLIFQQFNLIPSLSVADNLAFQARLAGRHDTAWTAELAERLGLTPLLARYPEQLSGGQQQRVAIGRTLAARPEIVLADEPTGNLDQATGDGVLALALELIAASGCAFLMVTHSPRLAERLDHSITLDQGRIAA